MKTRIYLIALLFFHAIYCAEQLPAGLMPIFNSIKHEIDTADKSSPAWELETFLQSDKAILFKAKLKFFSQEDKNKLIEKIYNIWGGDPIWPQRRNFIAAIVEAGGYIDTGIDDYNGTFLGTATRHNDKEAVLFALKHKANTCFTHGFLAEYVLQLAKKYSLALLLLEHKNNDDPLSSNHNALAPFRNNSDQQFKLLMYCTRGNYHSKLLIFYQQMGLNLALCDKFNWKLFHHLCSQVALHQPLAFFEKFLTLFRANAIDLDAVTNKGETALDIIKNGCLSQKNPTAKLAKALIEGLRKNPTLQMPRYKIKKDEPKK